MYASVLTGCPGHQKKDIRGSYDLEDSRYSGELKGRKAEHSEVQENLCQQSAEYGMLFLVKEDNGGYQQVQIFMTMDFYPGEYQKTYTFVTRKK